MELSNSLKIFSDVFAPLPKSTSNFEYFCEKDEPKSLLVSETIDCKKWAYLKA